MVCTFRHCEETMKRASLKSRRVRVVLPASRPHLPRANRQLLKDAFALGHTQAMRFIGSTDVRSDLFEKELEGLRARDTDHQGLRHLCSALFFSGLHVGIEDHSRKQPIVGQQALKNIFLSGAMTHKELTLAQLHLAQTDNAALFRLQIPGLLGEWWWRQCAGAIAVARLAHFLVGEGLLIYFPTPAEDAHWKIDLIAKTPHKSVSICFQVKSDQSVTRIFHRVHRVAPNGNDSDATHRFWQGVRRFQEHTHGIYVPVELTFSSWHFADGALTSNGYFLDALHEMLNKASEDELT